MYISQDDGDDDYSSDIVEICNKEDVFSLVGEDVPSANYHGPFLKLYTFFFCCSSPYFGYLIMA